MIMKIVVSTTNKAKLKAVEDVLTQVWSEVEIIGKQYPSDISDQPMSEKEGIDGALNRARNTQQDNPGADIWIGMEGYVDSNEHSMFLAGAVAIINKGGQTGIGISAKMQLPDSIRKELESGVELGPLVQVLMKDNKGEIRHGSGTNGVLTKGLYGRVDEFKDATKCALAKFISPELY